MLGSDVLMQVGHVTIYRAAREWGFKSSYVGLIRNGGSVTHLFSTTADDLLDQITNYYFPG